MRKLWLLLALTFMISTPARAIDFYDPNGLDWVEHELGCTGEICVIRYNQGGITDAYIWAAQQALARGIHVIVDGLCESSCVIFASQVRTDACITKNARIGIHMGFTKQVFDPSGKRVWPDTEESRRIFAVPPKGYTSKGFFRYIEYGDDINDWAKANNKMPPPDDMYFMTHEEALMFWRPCPE